MIGQSIYVINKFENPFFYTDSLVF